MIFSTKTEETIKIALAVASFAVAHWLEGSGFIACFVGGMLFGGLEKQRKHKLLLAAEGTGDTLGLDHLGGIQEPHGLNLNI